MDFLITDEDLKPASEPWVVTEADLLPAAGKPAPAPRKPVGKPKKKPRQPVAFTAPAIGPQDQESYDFEVEGGMPQVKLQVKPSMSLDFRSPEVSFTTETPVAKLKPVKARRRTDESEGEFAIRQAKFEYGQKQRELQAKAERAAVRSKVTPDKGLEKYPLALAQGVSNVLSPLIRQGGLARGIGPEETWDQQMPVLNEKEAGQWSTKVAEGLGSTIPFALAGALTGTAGTALLGASSNAAQTYEEALAHGTSHDDALRAAIPGAIIGSLEGLMGLGTGRFVEQMGKGTVKSLLAGIGEEEFQELTSQVLNNVNAKILSGYDPQRAISEGMWDTFTTTLGTAGLAHGATMISPQQHAAQALEVLPIAEQLKVGDALADPSPRSFASLPPKVREAAMLNWHMEAHPSLKEADGTPKTFYHGTPAGEFHFFDPAADENVGSHFGSQAASNMFSDSGIGTAYPVYLNIKNPAVTSDIYPVYDLVNSLRDVEDQNRQPIFTSNEIEIAEETYKQMDPSHRNPGQMFKALLEAKGFDGLQYINAAEDRGHTSYIAFYPHQVKSAFAKEFDPQTIKIQASFKPNELQAMEQRAMEAGKPIALRPETRDAYVARNQEIKTQLLTMDPSSPEFARLADEHTRLARAIDDSPATVPQSAEELRQHLIQMNMGHEGAAGEILDILRPPANGSPLKMDIDKYQASYFSEAQGARFYPLNNETKGGTVYVTPQTLEDTGLIGKGQRSDASGLNVSLNDAWNAAAALQESQPDAAAALVAAVKEAEAKGISKISILTYAEGQGFSETRKLMRHESFHSGQQAAAETADVVGIDPRDLHSPDLIYNPLVNKAAQSENGQAILKYYDGNQNDFALEMAAYSAADQHDYLGLTKEEAASYLTDYLTGIADLHGPDALDALAGTARLSPRVDKQVKEISSEAKPKKNFGQANRDFAAQLRSQPSASGRPAGSEGRSEGGSSVDEGGVAEGGDQDEVGRVAGGAVEGPPSGSGGPDSAVKNDGPELFTTVLTSDVVKEYAKKSGEALRKLGLLDENSLLPPHEQILKVLKERPDLAEPAALGAALREQGVTGEETLKQIDEAAANAGRTLQAIQAADAQWTQIIKEHPEVAAELAKAGVGPKPEQIIKQGFKEIQTSILGRSLWRRSGDLYRKMLLTRFSTAANNAVSTLPRIPLDLVDGAMTGTAMGMLQPEKWAGKSDASLAEGAKAGALSGMQASTRMAMAFPDVARKFLRRETPAHNFNEMVIAQMEQLHPDLHSKLEGRSTGLDEFKESSVKLDTIRGLLPYLNDAAKFKEYSAKLDMYQKRYDFNHKLAGKLFDKTNWVYDQFLKPGNVQEFFFRRPYFVGALANRAAAAGFNLSELAANAGTLKDFAADPGGKDAQAIMQLQTLADLPPEVWEAAADDALTFTYAYNPHRDRGGIEKFASHYIEFMDSLGPVGAVVDAFPKAVYNGLKFAYEYGPIGMIKPVANIADNVYQGGGRNGIEYNDVSRISKALLGTAMYATAIGIRKELGGDEWWQIKTGKKNKKGEPEYLNVKKWMPFAGFLYVADLILRMKNGRMIDKKPGDDIAELYLGARRADSGGTVFSESIKEVADYWASGDPLDDTLLNKAGKPLGNILGAPLTPLINLRDLIGQFDEDEAARRDMKESPFLGPAIDRIPWLRSSEKYGLPLYQPPTELAPRPANAQPALSLGGIATDPGSNFATREFSRLGLSPVRWLRPDPDPLINRAQYAAYAEILQELGPALEADATYKAASDAEKGAMWEQLLSGSEGYASMAKAQGELANPEEIQRRELLKTQGPLQRKASGLEKEVKEMKKQAQPRP